MLSWLVQQIKIMRHNAAISNSRLGFDPASLRFLTFNFFRNFWSCCFGFRCIDQFLLTIGMLHMEDFAPEQFLNRASPRNLSVRGSLRSRRSTKTAEEVSPRQNNDRGTTSVMMASMIDPQMNGQNMNQSPNHPQSMMQRQNHNPYQNQRANQQAQQHSPHYTATPNPASLTPLSHQIGTPEYMQQVRKNFTLLLKELSRGHSCYRRSPRSFSRTIDQWSIKTHWWPIRKPTTCTVPRQHPKTPSPVARHFQSSSTHPPSLLHHPNPTEYPSRVNSALSKKEVAVLAGLPTAVVPKPCFPLIHLCKVRSVMIQ